MQQVFVHHDLTVVALKRSILEMAGFDCFIRNENTSASLGAGVLGLVNIPIFHPALCIVDDSRYEEALALLNTIADSPAGARGDWSCPQCGENVPGNFETCWKCAGTGSDAA